jgi:hypothetical protein
MVKRRRGSRTAHRLGPRVVSRHRRFADLVDEALAGIPMPFAAALDESRDRHRRRTVRRTTARERAPG